MPNIISRIEYKVALLLLKYFPISVLLCTMISSTLIHFGYITPLYILFSPSLISLILMIILSNLFKFCYVHRLSIYWMIIGKFLQMFTGNTLIDLMPQAYTTFIVGGIGCIIYTLIFILFGKQIRKKLGLLIEDEEQEFY